jgi:TonB family protein
MALSRIRFALAGLVVVAGLTGVVLAQTAPPTPKPGQEDEFLKGAHLSSEEGLTVPVALKMVNPKYTPDAMRAKIQGQVRVQAVIATDGTVDRVRVVQSLDRASGLDDAALEAAKKWLFSPGKLKDKAVPVAVEFLLDFRLH